MRRILGFLTVLALVLGTGCEKPAETADATSTEGEPIKARDLPTIWADLLAQRDRIHAAVSKGTDMWHPDCEEVSAAAAAVDGLSLELGQRVEADLSVEARRRSIHEVISYMQTTASSLRENAIEETIGAMPPHMIALDAILQALENRFTPEEIGSVSVVSRPGFNPIHPPQPPSPI